VTPWAWVACVVGYVVIALVTARQFMRVDLEKAAQRELTIRRADAARQVSSEDAVSSEEDAERWIVNRGPLITQDDRDNAIITGLIAGVIWPVAWSMGIALALASLMRGLIAAGERRMTKGIVPSSERDRLAALAARRERQELDFLRKQARDLVLPFPGGDDDLR
jgi:hypothetical protein